MIITVLNFIMMMLAFLFIIVVVGLACLTVVGIIGTAIVDYRFVQQMRAAGRYLAWKDVAAELEKGRGTLIFEWFYPNGQEWEWWVPDDIISLAPTPIPKWEDDGLLKASGPLEEYIRLHVLKYIDPVYGTAKLTELPQRGVGPILKMCRVVTLVRYDNQTVRLVLGHVLYELRERSRIIRAGG